jgi:hypothetical protein
MSGEGLTHGPPADKKLAAVTTDSAKSSGISCAMVLRLPRGPGLPPLLATFVTPANLTSASGGQDHTI